MGYFSFLRGDSLSAMHEGLGTGNCSDSLNQCHDVGVKRYFAPN